MQKMKVQLYLTSHSTASWN